MTGGDIVGVFSVYIYVALLLLLSEKVLGRYPLVSRKFLHIMVGNVFFLLPLFETPWVMSLVAAAPFIFLTFMVSPHSPLKIVSSTSAAGHGLGLVYYAISWTILAYVFFETPWIIAMGIVAMSYGDGFASLIGSRYGKRGYNICGDRKTIEGSIVMFVTVTVMAVVALSFFRVLTYDAPLDTVAVLLVAAAATVAEGMTPKGLDNLSVSFTAALLYFGLTQ
jgi:dolichol kinase